MRWAVFAVVAFIAVTLDRSFMGVLALPTIGNIAPNIVITLAVFIALFASRWTALAGAFILGALMDLTDPIIARDGAAPLHLIGPGALGYLLAAYLVVQIRTTVFRQRMVTIAVLSAVCVMIASLVAVTIFVIRSWYGEPITYPTEPSAMRELLRASGIAIYSGLLAIPIGWVLLAGLPVWGFQWGQPRGVAWR